MSLPRQQTLKPGRLEVIIMDFNNEDVLPMHAHNFDDAHITIIARGAFEVRSLSQPTLTLKAGAYLDWPSGTSHEFKAIEDDSRLFNVRKIR